MPLRRTFTINPTTLRHIHAARIFHAIRRCPNMSQREIGDMAGADKSTVSVVVQDFAAMGLIERSLNRSGRRPGRPGEAIMLSPRGGLLIGLHLRPQGITYTASGLDGDPLLTLRRALPEDPAALGGEVAAGIAELTQILGREEAEIRAIGVAVPGLVRGDGLLTLSPNLGWSNVDIRERLAGHVARPLFIDNNANAVTVAEFMFGRGFESGDFAYVESGSGVGAGLFLDGALYRGAAGFAGEFGHTKIVPQGRLCRCGNLGCVSAYASDYSILQRMRQMGCDAASREDALDLAKAGDERALATLREAGQMLGAGLANVVNLLNIQLFILGGGLAAFAPFMLAETQRALAQLALPSAAEGCVIATSEYGDRGGIALALEGCTSLRNTEAAPW
jgi:predicted NBD/HSP70 family sugar kinase